VACEVLEVEGEDVDGIFTESVCTRCNAKLIDGFKQKGDWCVKHDLPESQCLACLPELKSKFEAMTPKRG